MAVRIPPRPKAAPRILYNDEGTAIRSLDCRVPADGAWYELPEAQQLVSDVADLVVGRVIPHDEEDACCPLHTIPRLETSCDRCVAQLTCPCDFIDANGQHIETVRVKLSEAESRPRVARVKFTGGIEEADCDAFASSDWQPSRTRMTPVATALWRGGAQMSYVITNADGVRPEAIEYLADAGEYIRRKWSRSYKEMHSDRELLTDLAERLEEAARFIRSKLNA